MAMDYGRCAREIYENLGGRENLVSAACLAVGLKSKNHKTRAVAIPSSLSAGLGITEPAIFGVNLRFMKPLLCGMAGGACGAVLGGFSISEPRPMESPDFRDF